MSLNQEVLQRLDETYRLIVEARKRERLNQAISTYFGIAFGVTYVTVTDANPIIYLVCAGLVYLAYGAWVLRK